MPSHQLSFQIPQRTSMGPLFQTRIGAHGGARIIVRMGRFHIPERGNPLFFLEPAALDGSLGPVNSRALLNSLGLGRSPGAAGVDGVDALQKCFLTGETEQGRPWLHWPH